MHSTQKPQPKKADFLNGNGELNWEKVLPGMEVYIPNPTGSDKLISDTVVSIPFENEQNELVVYLLRHFGPPHPLKELKLNWEVTKKRIEDDYQNKINLKKSSRENTWLRASEVREGLPVFHYPDRKGYGILKFLHSAKAYNIKGMKGDFVLVKGTGKPIPIRELQPYLLPSTFKAVEQYVESVEDWLTPEEVEPGMMVNYYPVKPKKSVADAIFCEVVGEPYKLHSGEYLVEVKAIGTGLHKRIAVDHLQPHYNDEGELNQ